MARRGALWLADRRRGARVAAAAGRCVPARPLPARCCGPRLMRAGGTLLSAGRARHEAAPESAHCCALRGCPRRWHVCSKRACSGGRLRHASSDVHLRALEPGLGAQTRPRAPGTARGPAQERERAAARRSRRSWRRSRRRPRRAPRAPRRRTTGACRQALLLRLIWLQGRRPC